MPSKVFDGRELRYVFGIGLLNLRGIKASGA